jgi:hypothetical protein
MSFSMRMRRRRWNSLAAKSPVSLTKKFSRELAMLYEPLSIQSYSAGSNRSSVHHIGKKNAPMKKKPKKGLKGKVEKKMVVKKRQQLSSTRSAARPSPNTGSNSKSPYDNEENRDIDISLVFPHTGLYVVTCQKCRDRMKERMTVNELLVGGPWADSVLVRILLCSTCLAGNRAIGSSSEMHWPSPAIHHRRALDGEIQEPYNGPPSYPTATAATATVKVEEEHEKGGGDEESGAAAAAADVPGPSKPKKKKRGKRAQTTTKLKRIFQPDSRRVRTIADWSQFASAF